MSVFTKILLIAVVATLPLAAANASDDNHAVRVRTDDINLATTSGQKILALRIDRAARNVCDFASDRLDHKVRKIERKCRDIAKASAWATVKSDKRVGVR
jgi:UrcA family protein